MQSFEGECLGGPWNGKKLAHWAKTKELFSSPSLAGRTNWYQIRPDEVVQLVKIGEYRLGDFHHWHWHETVKSDGRSH
jgi:hypothetical protein